MTARPEQPIDTKFDEYGTLERPGPVGRTARLVFGALLLWWTYTLLTDGPRGMLDTTAPRLWLFWVGVAWAFWLTPYVINIGFTRSWRRQPQYVLAALAAIAIGVDLLVWNTWWAPALGLLLLVWLVYFTAHLGSSFVLAAAISTPGCEMRAIPHLWTLLSGRRTKEHYCPGLLDNIDRWERQLRKTG